MLPDVPELAHLRRGRVDELGMTMPQNRPAESGEQIEILLAIGIPKIRSLPAIHHHRLAGIVADQYLRGSIQDFF